MADSSESEEDYEHVAEDDMYHVSLLDKLDQILANQYRIQGQIEEIEIFSAT